MQGGHYQSTSVVSATVAARADQVQGGRTAPMGPTSHHTHVGDLNAHDGLLMASELLHHRPTHGGFDILADHIAELVTVARRAWVPHPSSRPPTLGVGGSLAEPLASSTDGVPAPRLGEPG